MGPILTLHSLFIPRIRGGCKQDISMYSSDMHSNLDSSCSNPVAHDLQGGESGC